MFNQYSNFVLHSVAARKNMGGEVEVKIMSHLMTPCYLFK